MVYFLTVTWNKEFLVIAQGKFRVYLGEEGHTVPKNKKK